jgi:hypothetical protein
MDAEKQLLGIRKTKKEIGNGKPLRSKVDSDIKEDIGDEHDDEFEKF